MMMPHFWVLIGTIARAIAADVRDNFFFCDVTDTEQQELEALVEHLTAAAVCADRIARRFEQRAPRKT
jgi:hypothetical protein